MKSTAAEQPISRETDHEITDILRHFELRARQHYLARGVVVDQPQHSRNVAQSRPAHEGLLHNWSNQPHTVEVTEIRKHAIMVRGVESAVALLYPGQQ